MESIGERILELRKQFDLSQKELAEKIGITEASLSRYENNLREPKAEIIARISEVLQCSTDYLLGRTENKRDYTKSDDNLHSVSFKSKGYKSLEKKIEKRLLNEGIIEEDESITENIVNKVLKYGIEATIEILKLEKKLEK